MSAGYHVLKKAGVGDEGEPERIRCSCGWQWRAGRDDFGHALKAHLAAFGIDANPVGPDMPNVDLVETWEVDGPDEVAHFGLPWNGHGYVLRLLNERQTNSHGTDVVEVVEGGSLTFREGWPTEWPEHNASDCSGHGAN